MSIKKKVKRGNEDKFLKKVYSITAFDLATPRVEIVRLLGITVVSVHHREIRGCDNVLGLKGDTLGLNDSNRDVVRDR